MVHKYDPTHLVCDVEDEDEGVSRAVVALRDGAEALLAGRVPDLQLDLLPSTSTVLIMKSTPMVAPCPGGNMPCVNRRTRHVLPTPALPTSTTLKRYL